MLVGLSLPKRGTTTLLFCTELFTLDRAYRGYTKLLHDPLFRVVSRCPHKDRDRSNNDFVYCFVATIQNSISMYAWIQSLYGICLISLDPIRLKRYSILPFALIALFDKYCLFELIDKAFYAYFSCCNYIGGILSA